MGSIEKLNQSAPHSLKVPRGLNFLLAFLFVICPGIVVGGEFEKWFNEYVSRLEQATIGIHIVDTKNSQTLFAYNAEKLLKPASTAKIVTGALYLDKFGPDFTIKTPIYLLDQNPNGTLAHGLAISGRGDISLGARFYEWDYTKGISRLVKAIEETGVREIQGPIILEDNYYKNSKYGTGWTWEDLQYYYGAPVSSLTNDDNVIDIFISPGKKAGSPCLVTFKPKPFGISFVNKTQTVGRDRSSKITIQRGLGDSHVVITGQLALNSRTKTEAVSVAHPAKWLGLRLVDALQNKGIKVSGKIKVVDAYEQPFIPNSKWKHAGSFRSFPSRSMLNRMMKRSQNLYAQNFLLQVGKLRRDHDSFYSSESAGIQSLKDWCVSIGIERKEIALDEGSGLSRSNLITPRAITRVLTHMLFHPEHESYINSLPIAGVDGALRYRLRNKETKGLIKAKSGSIKHVKALAGYLDRKDGRKLAFCILLNAFEERSQNVSGKAIVDEITLNIATRNF